MATVRLATAAAHFGRDVSFDLDRAASLITQARAQDADLLVLPHAVLGGYLTSLSPTFGDDLPPVFPPDHEVFGRLCQLAAGMVVCLGFAETDGAHRWNSTVAVHGDGVLGRHRKVHLPPGEAVVYDAGSAFTAFDTPVGRLGMLVDYDQTFPEAARGLALDGAEILTVLSAWPASVTRRAATLVNDRQARLFELYSCARAAENQVVVVASNLTGSSGSLQFLGQAKIVNPAGQVVARTGERAGIVLTEIDVTDALHEARTVQHHLKERRPDAYGPLS